MKEKILLLLLLLMPLVAQQGRAADNDKLLLVYYRGTDGLQRLDVFPTELLSGNSEYVNGQLRVVTANDTAFCYNEATVDSVATLTKKEVMSRLPSIVQLKFNNKYNDQVYTDVVADITGDSLITARVAGIGKWLTPSVQFSDDSARLYVGRELQLNKQSRRKFDKDVIYTVALPRQRCYEQVLVKEAVWDGETEQYVETPVELDASMFSGNLPGRDGEGWAQMLDGDVNTFYHSTWDVPQEEKETIYNTEPYIEIALPEELSRLRFGYTTRNNDGYAPLKLTLYASKDGKSWKNIRSFTADEDGLPTGAGQTYESQQVDLGSSYKYLRLRLMESQRHRYLVFSEFRLWRVTENPTATYNDCVAGVYAGVTLGAASGLLDLAKEDGNFDKYAYISETTSTSYFGGLNLNRGTFALESGAAASAKTEQQKIDTTTALQNKAFRQALQFAFDKGTVNATSRGEDLKYTNLRNMYTHPEFVSLSEDTTVDGVSFPAGTFYGEMVQYYLDEMGSPIKVADQIDGWYNPDAAKAALAQAKEELDGIVSWPIIIDVVYYSASDANTAQAQAYKSVIEGTLGAENVQVNLIETTTSADFYACGYRASNGEAGNFDMFYGSGWGPDYGDPSTYLDTFAGEGAGYMTKVIGLF